jgi:hypothetical protein
METQKTTLAKTTLKKNTSGFNKVTLRFIINLLTLKLGLKTVYCCCKNRERYINKPEEHSEIAPSIFGPLILQQGAKAFQEKGSSFL